MQLVHESIHTLGDIRAFTLEHRRTKPHFHKNYELVYVISGALEAEVDDVTETAAQGEFIMILPCQVHRFQSSVPTKTWVCIFREEFIKQFDSYIEGKKGAHAAFSCDDATLQYLHSNILTNQLFTDYFDSIHGATSVPLHAARDTQPIAPNYLFELKACLSAVFACYIKQMELVPRKQADKTLAYQLLLYIFAHFREDISLNDVAKALGYSASYLSRCQQKILGTSFRQFLNQQRLAYAQELMNDRKMPLGEIAVQSGFGSVRNFNRVFKELTGKTPSEIDRGEGRD